MTLRTSLLYHYTFRKCWCPIERAYFTEEIPLFNARRSFRNLARWCCVTPEISGGMPRAELQQCGLQRGRHGDRLERRASCASTSELDYHPIRRRFSFARSIRIGILKPYRDTVSLTFPAPTTPPLPTVIPLPERFFAGRHLAARICLEPSRPARLGYGFPVGGRAADFEPGVRSRCGYFYRDGN